MELASPEPDPGAEAEARPAEVAEVRAMLCRAGTEIPPTAERAGPHMGTYLPYRCLAGPVEVEETARPPRLAAAAARAAAPSWLPLAGRSPSVAASKPNAELTAGLNTTAPAERRGLFFIRFV